MRLFEVCRVNWEWNKLSVSLSPKWSAVFSMWMEQVPTSTVRLWPICWDGNILWWVDRGKWHCWHQRCKFPQLSACGTVSCGTSPIKSTQSQSWGASDKLPDYLLRKMHADAGGRWQLHGHQWLRYWLCELLCSNRKFLLLIDLLYCNWNNVKSVAVTLM